MGSKNSSQQAPSFLLFSQQDSHLCILLATIPQPFRPQGFHLFVFLQFQILNNDITNIVDIIQIIHANKELKTLWPKWSVGFYATLSSCWFKIWPTFSS